MDHRGDRIKRAVIVGVTACAVLFGGAFAGTGHASPARQSAPPLGTAASFAVLAGSTVTNTGPTIISGDVGVSPGTAVTGFQPAGPGIILPPGTIHTADATANTAQADNTVAYNNLNPQPCTADLTGQDLGGLTLSPGVYCFDSSAQLTGALTLDGQGHPDAVFIFKIGSTLTTASASSVLLENGASSCNVYWQVGSSATLGTTTSFAGNILALASIGLNTGATLSGRALAQTGAVTLDTNTVSTQCLQSAIATATTVPGATATSVPATATAVAPTTTAGAVTTSTSVAAATSTAIAAATATANAAATANANAAATATAAAISSLSVVTATPVPTATPVVPSVTLRASPILARHVVFARHGRVLTFQWRMVMQDGIRGYRLFARHHPLTRVIKPHHAPSYAIRVRWNGSGPFFLKVLTRYGKPLRIHVKG